MRGCTRPAATSSSKGRRAAATPSRKNPGSTIRPAFPGKPSSPPAKAPTMATAPANASRASRTRNRAARRSRCRPRAVLRCQHCAAMITLITASWLARRRDESVRPSLQHRPEPHGRSPFNVLFLCTGNSARSIMAEAILNKVGAGKFRAYSAGSQPKGQVHPETLRLLQSLGYDTSGFRSKSWNEFAEPGAPALDFVFTVCDNAAARGLPGVAGPADDGALGRSRSGRSQRARRPKSRSPSKTPIGCSISASGFSRRCRCARSTN